MDAGSLSLLHRLASMGAYSLLQYVGQSFPWSGDKSLLMRTHILTMAGEERDAAARLVRILQKKHVLLRVKGGFPSHYTSGNFVSIDYLLPKLIAEHEKEVAEIERALPKADDEEARALAQGYLDMKRRHLDALRGSSPSPITH
jgi:hypothetical protein